MRFVLALKEQKPNKDRLEDTIDAILEEMVWVDSSSEEYTKMADNLERVCRAKSYENNPKTVNPDTIITVLGGITQIALILYFEKVDIVTSKALGFVMRPKL